MIPKVIHYCWFGGGEMPEDAKKYIASWKKECPDYEILEWNEKNFDIQSNKYVREAYEAKKWAFVSDYVRLFVLYEHGGIYMDTDVELVKNLDEYLDNEAFSGFESETDIPTGIIASVRYQPLFREFLEYYDDRSFRLANGRYDTTTNVEIITSICEKYGLLRNNTKQTIRGFTLYPSEYFCPKSHKDLKIYRTQNTVAIHHFSGSWMSSEAKRRTNLLKGLTRIFGHKFGSFLFRTIFVPYRFFSNIKESGLRVTEGKISKRMNK